MLCKVLTSLPVRSPILEAPFNTPESLYVLKLPWCVLSFNLEPKNVGPNSPLITEL